jgi:hypothetical protein
MFYHNTKYNFPLWRGSPEECAGGIIAASAMPLEQLKRRQFAEQPYLQHRLFDPQLYLALLDAGSAPGAVHNLASYPWFGGQANEQFDKKQHKTLKAYKNLVGPGRLAHWPRSVPSDPTEVAFAARSAVELQIELGCESIILPSPLVDPGVATFGQGTAWIDAGLAACAELDVRLPIYATLALCDSVVEMRPALENTFIGALTEQIAAREGLSGAYVVVETRSGDAYSFGSGDVVQSLIVIVDDLVRGAGRKVMVNYAGSFGAVLAAVGADIWSSGYYLSQRRLKTTDFTKKQGGSQRPRYFSLPLAGDIGVEKDLDTAVKAKLLHRIITPSPTADPLHAALRAGKNVAAVPGWEYQGTVAPAGAHYNACMVRLGAELEGLAPSERCDFIEQWLTNAVAIADDLREAKIPETRATELNHQSTWLNAFQAWRKRSGR